MPTDLADPAPAGAVAFWSLMTAACGLSTSYIQLFLARMGVALGESAHGPAGMSLIADVYPATKRGAAPWPHC